jgi:hypothetical protein
VPAADLKALFVGWKVDLSDRNLTEKMKKGISPGKVLLMSWFRDFSAFDLDRRENQILNFPIFIAHKLRRKAVFPALDSPAMTILKNKLEKQGLTLKKVKKIYQFISTDYLIKKIKNKNKIKVMIILSKNDIFCTYDELRTELNEFKKLKIKHTIKVNRFFGHILSIYKNLLFNKKIVDFIKG